MEQIVFSDETTWTLDDILANVRLEGGTGNDSFTGSVYLDNIFGGAGNDTITSGNGDDVITGGIGVDLLKGEGNSDTYVWSLGHGNDTIDDTSNSFASVDKLILTDVNPGQVVLTHASGSNDLVITIGGEVVTVKNRFNNVANPYGVDLIEFADGTVWNLDQILAQTRMNGTSGNNTLNGNGFADNIFGLGGNDTLNAGDGDDGLTGGTGNDSLVGSNVSDTQSFNIATSMGRLTLNMLLSFAQFEREVTAERIRDKIAASKRKGLWMGGSVPFGYQPNGRSLVIDETEAPVLRHLHALYLELGTVRAVAERALELGYRTRIRLTADGRSSGGIAFTRGHVYQILTNPIYAGRIRHRDKVFDGQHAAIISPERWQEVQDALTFEAARVRGTGNGGTNSPLAGKLFDETGDRLTPSHTQKNGKRLRYYISRRLITDLRRAPPDAWRLPAPAIEVAIADVLRAHLAKPALVFALLPDLAATEVAAFNECLNALVSD